MDFGIVLEAFERWFKLPPDRQRHHHHHPEHPPVRDYRHGQHLHPLLDPYRLVLRGRLALAEVQTPLAHCLCFGEEDLTDEEIHEVMNLIYDSNPPKYEIKDNQSAYE